MNMSLFKKKRNVPLPEPRTETPSKEMTEVHASPPAPDAAAVIGGLDWYRAQFHDQPLLTQEGLLTWASNAITGAMSLNFLEWREKLESLRPHFDDAAYKSFLASLQSSGVLDMIRDKRLSASAVATRAPVIIASGLVGGKATWKVEFPLIVSYESSQGVESTQKLLATVLVCRASTAKTPRGVVIQQVVLKRDA